MSSALANLVQANGDLPRGTAAGSVEHILKTIRAHLGMDVAFASHVTPGKVAIEHADMGECAPFQVGAVFPAEEGYCQRIIDGRLPYLIADTAAVPEAAALACTTELPVGAHLSVPIRLSDGRIYGTFCCFSFLPDHSLNERDVQMMHAFAELASAQIEARMDVAGREEEIAFRVRQIIEQDNLTMVYQPIFGLIDNRVVGVEALARFPDRETRPPSEWFAEAAGIGLGVELELTAVRAALRGLPYLPEDIYLAVNVSPETVLSNRLKPLLDKAPSGRIVLEVTEHAAVSDYPGLARALEPFRDHVGIAIDDVGAGYAGMRHILDLKPNIMKLDVSLVRDIHQDPARRALALAMAAFASGIDSELIAEGVESSAELLVLRELGVAKAQGYYLSRPMPLMAVRQFISGEPERPPAEFRTTRFMDGLTQAG